MPLQSLAKRGGVYTARTAHVPCRPPARVPVVAEVHHPFHHITADSLWRVEAQRVVASHFSRGRPPGSLFFPPSSGSPTRHTAQASVPMGQFYHTDEAGEQSGEITPLSIHLPKTHPQCLTKGHTALQSIPFSARVACSACVCPRVSPLP